MEMSNNLSPVNAKRRLAAFMCGVPEAKNYGELFCGGWGREALTLRISFLEIFDNSGATDQTKLAGVIPKFYSLR
jgi:hypothetical protein